MAGHARAQEPVLRFARIFSDHAVLQRDRPIIIWGWAAPRTAVTVALGDLSVPTRAGSDGSWRASLPAMPAGGPYRLRATAPNGEVSVADVKVGDVYLCSGQSNMEFPARLSTNAWSGLNDSHDDDLRFVTIKQRSEPAPATDLETGISWQVVSRDTVGEASAVCFYMARALRKTAKVPIGFIHSSWGGTTIQSWISSGSLGTLPSYAEGVRAVTLFATNPTEARRREERRQEAWWREQKLSSPGERAWAEPGADTGSWPVVPASGGWKNAGIASLAAFDGVMWLKSEVTLSAAQAGMGERIRLGPIDTYDTVWVNGQWVGSGSIFWAWRDYTLPAGVLRAGRNTVVIRTLGGQYGGGLTGQPEMRNIALSDGAAVPLDQPWHYHAGVRAGNREPPASPWVVPTSLTTLYNGMIAPLRGYGFKLAAWYQGEANVWEAGRYRDLLKMMMADWRRELSQPDLPFVVAQLTAFGPPATAPSRSDWAALRQAQAEAVAADAHAGLAVTVDVGDRFDIHPSQKTVVGERLARAARVVAYGDAGPTGGPEASGITRAGADLIVAFRHTGGGLKSYSSDTAIGFETCAGETCRFVAGTVRGDAVVLAGANRPEVTQVRYAWADAPVVNLFGADGLPTAPFALAVAK